MNAALADTSFFVAFLNPADEHHAQAVDLMVHLPGPLITTGWILAELGNFLAKGLNRQLFISFLQDWKIDPRVEIVPADNTSFEEGADLYSRRADKDWSFIDCVSFVLMTQRNMMDALTADRHFEQAGFKILLK